MADTTIQNEDYFLCSCYFSRNIFLQEYKLHVRFTSPDQFRKEYRETLFNRGCVSELDFQEVLTEVQEEVWRRRNRGKTFLRTKEQVHKEYMQLHPEVYTFQEEFLDSSFLEVVSYCKNPEATVSGFLYLPSVTNHGDRVYSFPVFSVHFCELILAELDNYERSDITKHRPNTMNRFGVLLSELSLDSVFDTLREHYLNYIANLLYPEWVGAGLDSNRAFTVKYMLEGDTALSSHFDNAEVTLNVCLGKQFTGGDLLVGGMWKILACQAMKTVLFNPAELATASKMSDWMQVKHVIGTGILHRERQMHLAQAVESGERNNLILWMRSSSVRNIQCPMCEQKPHLIPFQGFGDGFTKETTSYIAA